MGLTGHGIVLGLGYLTVRPAGRRRLRGWRDQAPEVPHRPEVGRARERAAATDHHTSAGTHPLPPVVHTPAPGTGGTTVAPDSRAVVLGPLAPGAVHDVGPDRDDRNDRDDRDDRDGVAASDATGPPTTAATVPGRPSRVGPEPGPMLLAGRPAGQNVLVKLFVFVPLLALVAAVPVAWGWGLSGVDIALGVFFYFLTCAGVTVGYHRYFTHRAFRAHRGLRVGLAIVGSMAFQGPLITWVADHRRHHAFTDKEGDPHSPWLFGTTAAAVAKGFWYSHFGWMLAHEETNPARFAPDLLADPDLVRVSRQFPLWTVVSLASPMVLGGLITWSWWGALTAFFWAGLVRIAVLHHVTWSINSICHMIGNRPWTLRDRSTNFWPLAIASMGESWHNLHHADPTCARHGVGPGQIDLSARIIAGFERLGWAHDVRWPTPRRLARLIGARDGR